MILRSIEIKNFRSIEDLKLEVEGIFFNHTFALIGVNESGKSNFLEAIALVGDAKAKLSLKDYTDRNKEIRITLNFELEEFEFEDDESDEVLRIISNFVFEEYKLAKRAPCIGVSAIFDPIKGRGNDSQKKFLVEAVVQRIAGSTQLDVIRKKELDNALTEFFMFRKERFQATLWKPEKEYIINESIDLNEFANTPTKFIPLLNCFKMAKLKPKDMLELTDAGERDVEGKLEDAVTNYINKAWPSYPVRIKFNVSSSNGKLMFLVEDKEVRNESKTMEQRSDGFRWFVSFLLTIAPDHSMDFQDRPLLLLDEPDLHLHPQAQVDLLRELIRITQGLNRKTVLFFATHSIHMVDKEHVERCYKFSKQFGVTEAEKADKGILNSYAEVNYSVFEAAGNDYHNELYGYLESTPEGKQRLNGLPRTRKRYNAKFKKDEEVSLSTYIRHSIHHPENGKNPPYTEEQLRESIETMRRLVQELKGGTGANRGNNPSQKK